MKSAVLGLALLGAAVSRGDVTSDWAHAQDQYSPPVLANGDLCGLFDYRLTCGSASSGREKRVYVKGIEK